MNLSLPAGVVFLVVLASAAAAVETAYEAQIRTWRDQREAGLKADDGWLTVVGLFWLKEGANRFGTGAGDILLPPRSAPPLAGVFEFHAGRTTVSLERGVEATVGGKPVRGPAVLRDDSQGEPDALSIGRLKMYVIRRGDRYGIRLKDPESPERRAFAGLRWYPVKEEYRIAARFVPYDPPKNVPVPNILGTVENLTSPGTAVFTLDGREWRLDPVLEEPGANQLFFIFRDGTSARETYGGGRFLYADMPKDGTLVLDFNKAYTPPCGFTAFATCPLPPSQNRLAVKIEAGEMWSGHGHQPPTARPELP